MNQANVFRISTLTVFFLSTLCSCLTLKAQDPDLMLPMAHTKTVEYAAYTNDGKYLITNGEALYLWDARTFFLLKQFNSNGNIVDGVSIDKDNRRIIVQDTDSIIVYDLVKGTKIYSIAGKHYAISPNGKLISINRVFGNRLEIYNFEDGALLKSLFYDKNYLIGGNTVSWQDDNHVIGASGQNIYIWDIKIDSIKETMPGIAAYYNIPGRKLMTQTNEGIFLSDADHIKDIKLLDDRSAVSGIFSADGKLIVTYAVTKDPKVWDTETGAFKFDCKRTGHYAQNRIEQVFFSPKLNYITVVSQHKLEVFNAGTGESIPQLTFEEEFTAAEISPDESQILLLKRDYAPEIHDLHTGKLITSLSGHISSTGDFGFSKDPLQGIFFSSPATELIRLKSSLERAFLWDIKDNHLIAGIKNGGPDHTILSYSKDGSTLLELTPGYIKYDVTDSTAINIYSAADGSLINTLNYAGSINSAILNHDGSVVLTAIDSSIVLKDVLSGQVIRTLKDKDGPATIAFFNPNESIIVSQHYKDQETIFWDVKTGKELFRKKNTASVYSVNSNGKLVFSPDSKTFALLAADTVSADSSLIFDAQTGNAVKTVKTRKKDISTLQFSTNGKFMLTADYEAQNAKIWDTGTMKLIFQMDDPKAYWNGEDLLVYEDQMTNDIYCYNLNTKLKQLIDKQNDVPGNYDLYFINFNPVAHKFLISGHDHNIKVYNETGTSLLSIDDDRPTLNASFSPDGKRIFSAADNGLNKVWDANNGKLLYTFLAIDSADYFIKIPSGYYWATPNASKQLHYVTKELKLITFDQLDIKYNRPDKVLEGMGSIDTALINSYRKAYEKRIKKLGIDTTSFKSGYNLPQADFKNRDDINYDQKKSQLKLHIYGADNEYFIDRFNIWINESPLFGIRGISLKNRDLHLLDTTIVVRLSDGENKIETSITNSNGTESYHTPLIVKYVPSSPANKKIYFIGIGINNFLDNRYDLKWSVKDIRDQAEALHLKYGKQVIIDTLFNEKVTVENVIKLKKKLLSATVNDRVIIAYSGHGLLSKDYDYYLSTYDINFKNPSEKGLEYDVLEDLLDNISPREKLMLIDACQSGEVDKEELIKLRLLAPKFAKAGVSGERGLTLVNDDRKIGMKSSFELMQQLFANVRRNTGATIIAAAAGTQFAREENNLKNGVFSYSILELMKKRLHVRVSELKQYVNKRVVQLTAGMQVPVARDETNTIDWEVW